MRFAMWMEDFAKELAALGYGKAEKGWAQVDAEAPYYMQLAQSYHLPVQGACRWSAGVLEPYSHASLGSQPAGARYRYLDQLWQAVARAVADLETLPRAGLWAARRHA